MFGRKNMKPLQIVGWVLLGIIGAGAFALLFGFVIVWVWNALLPGLFDFPVIGYWQAVGLLFLAKLFFGGHGGGKNEESKDKDKKRKRWEKWEKDNWDMDPEDWVKFRRYWKEGGKEHYKEYTASHPESFSSKEIEKEIEKDIEEAIEDRIERKIKSAFGEPCDEDSE